MALDVPVLDRCQHCLPRETKEGEELLEKLLPSGYTHLLCVIEPSDKEGHFRAHLKVKLSTEEEVEKWLQDLQHSSSLTWRKARTYPQSGRYNAYRVDLRCQYKIYSTGKLSRNTNCPATLFLVLKRHMEERKSRSTDPHMAEGYFLHVNWRNEHNHQLVCADALSAGDVCDCTWMIVPDDLFETLDLEEPLELQCALDWEHASDEEKEPEGITGTERLFPPTAHIHPVVYFDAHCTTDNPINATVSICPGTPEESTECLETQLDHIVGLLKN